MKKNLFTNVLLPWMLLHSLQYLVAQEQTYVPNQLLLQTDVNHNFLSEESFSLQQEIEAIELAAYPTINTKLWKVPDTIYVNDGQDILIGLEEVIEYCSNQSFIEVAEPNWHCSLVSLPNDNNFNQLWGLHNTGQSNGTNDADIDALEAWAKQSTNNTILVGVLDTGVDYEHGDLQNSMWTNIGEIPDDGVDNDNNGYIDDYYGYDFVNDDGDPRDDNGHGTHVTGTIAASRNNSIGIAGVTNTAKIVALKILNEEGIGNTSRAIEALEYCLMMDIPVTNNSWGGAGLSKILKTTLENANDEGHLFVAAAGNNEQNNDENPFYPANYETPNVISVAASDRNDQLASFSHYGQESVDLAAPGAAIYSTFLNNGYAIINGTSMATPHVTGAIALLWAEHPELSHLMIKEQLLNTVDPLESLQQKTVSGGRLNLYKMLDFVQPGDANNDDKVDMLDWLAVGLGQSKTGSPREDTGMDFSNKSVEDWPTNFSDDLFQGINHKHADSDGNGIVEPKDTLAVLQNYTSPLTTVLAVNNDETANLFIQQESQIIGNQQKTETTVFLRRNNTNLDKSIHGLAFSLKYSVPAQDVQVTFNKTTCLGEYGNQVIGNFKHFPNQKTVDIGITRLNKNNGVCGQEPDIPLVIFTHTVIVEDIPAEENIVVFGDNAVAISHDGAAFPIKPTTEEPISDCSGNNVNDIIYVNASATGGNTGECWEHAFTDLQDALDKAENSELKEIWVAQGIYYPSKVLNSSTTSTTDRRVTFDLVDGIKLYGGFNGTETSLAERDDETHITTLSGNLGDSASSDDNAFHVVYSEGVSTTTFDGFTVRDGSANPSTNSRHGGGLYNTNAEIIIGNCTFINNSGSNGGGVYSSETLTLANCTFTSNSAGNGGGVYCSKTLTLTDCIFTNNSASGGGGVHAAATSLTNCTFTNNKSAGNGGGVCASSYSVESSLVNCIFTSNSTNGSGNGGGFYSRTSSSFTNCTFTNNSASGGGGVHAAATSLTNCTFTNNKSVGNGGGVYASSYSVESSLVNCIFTSNSTNGSGIGGGFSSRTSSSFTNCTFTNNSAYGGGGVHAAATSLTNCTFTNNKSVGNGGGVCASSYSVASSLVNCIFTSNSTNGSGNGGGFYSTTISSLANCTFTNNAAHGGGGIHVAAASLTNCAFTNNKSVGNGGGGGTSSSSVASSFVNCIFTSNSSDGSGGGLFSNTTSSLTNCTFTNNAAFRGGGLAVNTSASFLTNCTFTNNTANGNNGGGLYLNGGSIINCTVTNNSSTRNGGGLRNTGTLDIQNSIFWNNVATGNTNNIYRKQGTLNLYHSLLEETTCPTGITCHEGNIFGQNPLFVNSGNNDFSLQANSPAINSGNNDYLPIDEYDLDEDGDTTEFIPYDIAGNVRTQDNVVDMGAYEGTGEIAAVLANFKVFLSGAYNTSTGLMNTELYNKQLIPINQPYNQSPWNYNGSESVANYSYIPNNTVDWILVEIRDEHHTTVEQKAGFLLNDGNIISPEANTNGLAFENLTIGEAYYVVIRHRNHLAVTSANTLTVNNNTLHYDFTTGLGQAWKNNSLPNEPMRTQDGISLLWNGNANGNQSVSYSGGSNDRTSILVPLGFDKSAVIQGYHAADVNMDGIVKYSGGGNDRTAVLAPLGFDKSRVITAHIP